MQTKMALAEYRQKHGAISFRFFSKFISSHFCQVPTTRRQSQTTVSVCANGATSCLLVVTTVVHGVHAAREKQGEKLRGSCSLRQWPCTQ
jgi:hypothetical protein